MKLKKINAYHYENEVGERSVVTIYGVGSDSGSECRAKFITTAKTTRKNFHLGVGGKYNIPYASLLEESLEKHGGYICGEVFEVNSNMLAALDKLEGVPEHYLRETEKVINKDGTCFDCYIYVKANFDSNLLKEEHLENYSLQIHAKYVPPPLRAKAEGNCKNETQICMNNLKKCYLNSKDVQTSALARMKYYQEFKTRVLRRTNAGVRSNRTRFLELGCENLGPVACDLLPEQGRKTVTDGNENYELHCFSKVQDIGQRFQIQHFHAISCINILDFIPAMLHWHLIRSLVAALQPNHGIDESVLFISWNEEHPFLQEYFEDACDLHLPYSKGRVLWQDKQVLFIV